MTAKIPLLVLSLQTDEHLALLAQHFDVTYAPDRAARDAAVATHGARYRAVLTNGSTGFSAAEIDVMPQLELICALGAGYENIALDAARLRGIALGNGAGTNDDCVADHAFGLLIAAVRGIVRLDRQCRDGVWRDVIPFPPNVSGRKLGIVGLGTIGQKIAKRASGFDMTIGYHNRRPREGVAHRYFDSLLALAEWADFLVIATPGGAGTRHLVNREILDALGPQGVLVNIARGSVVDTDALAAALREGRLGGAGLDVYESEPMRPEPLIGLDNVVLTPHMAGWSPEAVTASVQRFLDNAAGHFAGRGVVSPI
ncbi:2-hydroxyacid dehydrogenase [Variovorax ginsengisoli]|uniref:Lactate dehydrogenase-like 2-hydroxyacid dehydrogenase n=1 Tax=Variovorax ginsengisoli TaxID=363844 RepID=A0ABT9SB82_9BURK|nr:2-hydroxyacid dehydrogenase [Variovorax ginsengisoli]MDP9901613.1 lactate dehydrogenase-like 2-hydroxyacid dehydrogenase [Variovorax ginsengisoli]